MDPRRLELLMQVANFGSFSKAAAVLGIAQPALGRQIQKLENDYGARLLYRHGRGVSLTPEGQELLDRTIPLLHQLEAITADLQSRHAVPQGVVTLGLTPTISSLIGVRLIDNIRRKYPRLNLNIISGYSGYIHEWLISGRLDIAVLHEARKSTGIAVEAICASRLYLVMAPNMESPLQKREKINLAELAGTPLTLSSTNHGLRRTVDLAASRIGLELDILYELDTLTLAKELVCQGMAATILGRPAYLAEKEQGKLLEIAIDSPMLETRLMLAETSNRPVTRGTRVVKQEIQAIMNDQLLHESEKFGLLPMSSYGLDRENPSIP